MKNIGPLIVAIVCICVLIAIADSVLHGSDTCTSGYGCHPGLLDD